MSLRPSIPARPCTEAAPWPRGVGGVALLALCGLLAACAPSPVRDPLPPDGQATAVPGVIDPAAAAIARDDWGAVHGARAAAALAADADDAPARWLAAAEAALIAGDEAAARAALAALPVTLEAGLEAWRIWLRDLMDDRPLDLDTAAARLATLPPAAAPRFRLHWAEAALAGGRPLDALLAASEIEAAAAAVGPTAVARARRLAWVAARRSPEAPPPAARAALGWWALAEVLRHPGLSPLVSLDAWAVEWSGHPAQAERAAVEAEIGRLLSPPRRIALLLPLQGGPFSEAALAVRDGVMAAWLEDAANPERPAIRVIPTADGGLDAALAEAVTAGADLILGPLEREAVLALLDGRELPLPVLALNIVPVEERPPLGDPGNRLLQFGLLPEHEAAAAAEYAARQGWHAPALILPEGAWGERLRAAFERQHASLSGGPVTVRRYREGGDYQGLVRGLLAGGEEAAAPQPAAAPTAAATDPSVRPGWPGFVFVAGRSADVRQLVPYLRYYGAGALPRATTSLTWTGQVAPDQDLDLDGTLITEVPLLLGAASVGTVPFEQARAVWPRRGAQAWRLFAFGLDAYRLALNYGDLRLGRIGGLDGATGQITLEDGGTVQNHPGWAVFRGGRPRPLDAGVAP